MDSSSMELFFSNWHVSFMAGHWAQLSLRLVSETTFLCVYVCVVTCSRGLALLHFSNLFEPHLQLFSHSPIKIPQETKSTFSLSPALSRQKFHANARKKSSVPNDVVETKINMHRCYPKDRHTCLSASNFHDRPHIEPVRTSTSQPQCNLLSSLGLEPLAYPKACSC